MAGCQVQSIALWAMGLPIQDIKVPEERDQQSQCPGGVTADRKH